jgi:hypothetical protein
MIHVGDDGDVANRMSSVIHGCVSTGAGEGISLHNSGRGGGSANG